MDTIITVTIMPIAFLLLFVYVFGGAIFLPFVSSAFVPTASMPGPVRAFAENQPVTSIVNTIRALFGQQPEGNDIWFALAWCVGILVVAYVFAMVVYRRKIG
jgi:ABC-2 type transport system permease protein